MPRAGTAPRSRRRRAARGRSREAHAIDCCGGSCYGSVRTANHDRSAATSLPAEFPRRELILKLARRLAEHPAVERIWLFGSRARGDHFERSDIDLTIEAPAINRAEWTKLHLDLEEEADTLLLIDFVLMDDLPESFRHRVHREGKLLYERGNPAGIDSEPGQRARPVR